MTKMKSELLDWFPVDAAKTLSDQDLLGLDAEAFGVFWLIRLFCWKDGSVPADLKRLAVLCRSSEKRLSRTLGRLDHLLEHHPDEPGRLVVPLVEGDREVQLEKHEVRRRAGAARVKNEAGPVQPAPRSTFKPPSTPKSQPEPAKPRPVRPRRREPNHAEQLSDTPTSDLVNRGEQSSAMLSNGQPIEERRLEERREEEKRHPPIPPPPAVEVGPPVCEAEAEPGAEPPGVGAFSTSSSHSPEMTAVFDAHDLGLRALAEATGRPFVPHCRIFKKREKAVADALKTVGVDVARRAARNIALSPHHRGENDRRTRYLDIEYAMRRPESFAELFDGPDEGITDATRRSLEAPRGALVQQPKSGFVREDGPTRAVITWE